jgi:hypothetical protein
MSVLGIGIPVARSQEIAFECDRTEVVAETEVETRPRAQIIDIGAKGIIVNKPAADIRSLSQDGGEAAQKQKRC